MDNLAQTISRDPWLSASLMQKAIRRGEVDVAITAAMSLQRLRGDGCWRRLAVVAVEDVGIGDLNLVSRTCDLAFDSATRHWRRNHGDALSKLVAELCDAPKDRSADYLICSAVYRDDLEPARERCGMMNVTQLIAKIMSDAAPLAERAVASWYCSGINAGSEARFSRIYMAALADELAVAQMPASLVTILKHAPALRDPIAVMLPVLWMAYRGSSDVRVVTDVQLASPRSKNGTPLYGFDKHTALGKAAISQFVRECDAVAEAISAYVPDYRAQEAGWMAAYYADAAPVRRRLAWPKSDELESLGFQTDMRRAGVADAGHRPILNAVAQNLDHLHDARNALLQKREGTELSAAKTREGRATSITPSSP